MTPNTIMALRARLRDITVLWAAGAILAGIALPLFLITGNVRVITNSSWLYEYDFNRYNIERRTGLPREELRRASDDIVDYFNNDEEFLATLVNFGNGDTPLYKQREILHMKDVKDLMLLVNNVERGAIVLLLFFLITGAWTRGWQFTGLLRRMMIASGIGTLIVVAAVGIATAISFDAVFTQFHVISFANDLWLLDPVNSYLLRIFPEGFFLDATLMIAGMTVIEFAVLFGVVWGFARRADNRTPTGETV
ncbi:MAG: TIGR01906 family membrane protein [Chloroflexi bacterium]|nr:TIGR01906 family membrane protein [Chloroflexota bacterium]